MSRNKHDLLELYKKREKLEGTKIIRRTRHLANSQYIVNSNYKDLTKAFKHYDHNLSLWAIKDRLKFEAFIREFLRLLQNYLSSIYSLIQHTVVFYKDLNNPKLNKDYAKKLKDLRSNNCIQFVRDLRTYATHRELPFVTAKLSFTTINRETGEGKIETKLLLSKEELSKWKGWKNTSKIYINQYQGDIDLRTLTNEYHNLISKFYDWFYKRVIVLYKKEIKELHLLESIIKRLESGGLSS